MTSELSKYNPKVDKNEIAKLIDTSFLKQLRIADKSSKYVLNAPYLKFGQFYIGDVDPLKVKAVGNFDTSDPKYHGSVECLLGPWRFAALHIENNRLKNVSYDNKSKEWAEIQQASKRVKYPDMAGTGIEHILYIPECDQICTFWWKGTAVQYAPIDTIEPGTPIKMWSEKLFNKNNNATWYWATKYDVIEKPEWSQYTSKMMDRMHQFAIGEIGPAYGEGTV